MDKMLTEWILYIAQKMADAAFVEGRCGGIDDAINDKDNIYFGDLDPYKGQSEEFRQRRLGYLAELRELVMGEES